MGYYIYYINLIKWSISTEKLRHIYNDSSMNDLLTEDAWEDVHLSRAVGTFPADYFVFDASVTDFMTVSDEKLPDSFGSESLFSGMPEV